MKNYLIKGVHKIESPVWWPGSDRTNEGDLHGYYDKMNDLSVSSFFHNLQGDWEYIKLESVADSVYQVFRQQFIGIWNIWKREPCNIYYCGSDTQALKPVEVFGRYKHFMLFNYTDPKSETGYPHYLNADIRYYPAEMDREKFEEAVNFITDPELGWQQDQFLYNRMVWSQGLTPEEVIDPTMAYQGPWLPGDQSAKNFTDNWNGCRLEDAYVTHWHGSRNAQAKLNLMQYINEKLGIPLKKIPSRVIDVSDIP